MNRQPNSFFAWRWQIFIGIFVGYALFYFTRKAYGCAMLALVDDLGYDKAQLGFLGTMLSVTYAFSKFAGGVLTDKTNPRYLMGFGLMFTGVFNICFGLSSTLYAFAIFLALNGWFQGTGAPPCVRLLIHWYPKEERGLWWGIWNTSHNIGGGLIPIIVAGCLLYYDWRMAMYVPGVICILGGLMVIWLVRDTPESLGFKPVEVREIDDPQEEKPSLKSLMLDHVLCNSKVLALGGAYFFVQLIRTSLDYWIPFYLKEVRGETVSMAIATVFLFEGGGFLGSLFSGWGSDRLFQGRRAPMNLLCMIGATVTVVLFWFSGAWGIWMDRCLIFCGGFFIFGPQNLVGMAASEAVDRKAAATANGFVGIFAYLGAASAGWLMGSIIQGYGWTGYFVAMIGAGVVTLTLLAPLWIRSTEQYKLQHA